MKNFKEFIKEKIDYKIKDGKIHISKANFRKVHRDYKSTKKGDERMMAIDPKTGGTVSYEVIFEEFMEVRDKSKGDWTNNPKYWTKLPDNFWVLIDRSKGKMGEVIKTGKTKPKFTSSKSQELMTVKKAKQWFGIK